MTIPVSEQNLIIGMALPDSWHTLKKGTLVLCFESRRKRLEAQRNLAGRGIQSVNITARKQYKVPDSQYGLQIIWIQVSYLVDNESAMKEMIPRRPVATGDTLKKHVADETPDLHFDCPFGYFKVTTNSLGQRRVAVHSQPVSIRQFAADEIEEYKNYISFLWESGMINIDGIYSLKFDEESGMVEVKLTGGLRHGELYEIAAEELAWEEYYLKLDGYTKLILRKESESSNEPEFWLASDKMNSRN